MSPDWSRPLKLTPGQENLLASMKAGIDESRLRAVRRRHGNTGFGRHKQAFLDLPDLVKKDFEHAVRLGLHDTVPCRILDIGTGAGAFPYVLKHLGHEVVATERANDESIMWSRWHSNQKSDTASAGSGSREVPEESLYESLTRLLGIDRLIWTVEAYTPAPELGERFDLVCARGLYFDRPRRNAPVWDLDAWRYFVSDVESRLLRPEGLLYMSFPTAFDERKKFFDALAAADIPVSEGHVVIDRSACRRFFR